MSIYLNLRFHLWRAYDKAVCTDHEALSDEMTIQKVSEPNPAYFMDATKVCNWFEEPQEESEKEEGGYLSLNSTMAEIQAVPAGAALLAQMMKQMQGSVAGGMGKNVKIPETMMALIARQPLKKLLAQRNRCRWRAGEDACSSTWKDSKEIRFFKWKIMVVN